LVNNFVFGLHKYKKFTNRFGNNVLNGNNRKPNGKNATMKSAKPKMASLILKPAEGEG